MLLLMIERDMPIDVVLFADTGMEFPEMYAHLEKLDAYLYEKRGIHITILRAKHSFEYLISMSRRSSPKPSRIESRKGFRFTATAGLESRFAGVPASSKHT